MVPTEGLLRYDWDKDREAKAKEGAKIAVGGKVGRAR